MSRDPRRLPEYLPQYGFGTETEFKKLVEQNAFLFRVHSPKSPSQSGTLFPALRFDQRYTLHSSLPSSDPPPPTYDEVVRHMDWTTRPSSPYVSASFSFMWVVWEAVLRSVSSADQHKNHWKWYRFAQESQLVLVYGGIPQVAVLTSVPLLRILDKLPSYCLRPLSAEPPPNQLERLSPSFLLQQPSFRNLCIAESAAFLCASPDIRFRDSTTAAVRLALAFIGIWFHWMLQLHPPRDNDSNIFFDAAVTKLTEFARIIAAWPAAGETNKNVGHPAEVKTHRRIVGAETISHSSATASKSPPAQNSDAKVECPDDSVPIWLDPRNFLPTPPPTPPPILMSHHSAFTERALRVPDSASSPHDENVDVGTHGPLESSHNPEVPTAHGVPASAGVSSAKNAAAGDSNENAEETVVQSISSAPTSPLTRPLRPQLHSMSDTASCLLTGFFFGALIVLVLSTRRPALLYVS
ncbi:hypothetical protein B0H12DRAFT_1126821 [Mycena haematopus]|nr:hypothetical protein B0H12DRAFT_1126821 [Mycena haematopus]